VLSLDKAIQGGMEQRDTFADVDTLGPPTGYPDKSGSMAWLSSGKNPLPWSSQ
jgi:hypothetical protein